MLQQWWAHAHVDAVLGPHGAGLANAMLLSPGGAVFEVIPFGWWHRVPTYPHYSTGLGLEHHFWESALRNPEDVGSEAVLVEVPVPEVLTAVCGWIGRMFGQGEEGGGGQGDR